MKLLSQAELSTSTIKSLCSNWLVYDRLVMGGNWINCAITYREATAFRDKVDAELKQRNLSAWTDWQLGLMSTIHSKWSPAQYFNKKAVA